MVGESEKGLPRVNEIYRDPLKRARELKGKGKQIFGYLCIYPVVEMITALNLVPLRVFGDMREPITKADNYLTTVACPFLRSCLDLGLKGRYDFLDGIVTAHICDVGSSIAGIWNYSIKTPFCHQIDVPHTAHETALEQQRELLELLQASPSCTVQGLDR